MCGVTFKLKILIFEKNLFENLTATNTMKAFTNVKKLVQLHLMIFINFGENEHFELLVQVKILLKQVEFFTCGHFSNFYLYKNLRRVDLVRSGFVSIR